MTKDDTITLPRAVVEQALKAWAQARGALAYVAVGNAPSNQNLARSTCSQAVWVLDNAEPALRAALEKPQGEQPTMTAVAQRKLDDLLTSGYQISGYSIYHYTKQQHGFVTAGGLVGWWKPEGAEYPQPQVDQQPVQPLTDEQIRNIFTQDIAFGRLVKVIRMIERAHGIGGEA